ncbi:MAG: hypothetical protein HYT87_12940 [Nitrospirae bacterium]|nr:hypothetical protein [Nitrospirota bacterium]
MSTKAAPLVLPDPLFTREPWKIRRSEAGGFYCQGDLNSGSVEMVFHTGDIRQADARLIEAAPKLYRACVLALEVIRRERLEGYNGEDEFVDPDGVLGIGDVLKGAIGSVHRSNHSGDTTEVTQQRTLERPGFGFDKERRER